MSRSRILVLQNSRHAPAGLIGERIDAAGGIQEVRLIHEGDAVPADPAGYAGLLVLGGPMNALEDADYPNLRDAARLIGQFAGQGRPILGICLGAQLMARALGGAVRPNPEPEIGFTRIDALPAAASDPLFGGLTPLPPLMHWHYDTFDLPDGAAHLAATALCPSQAFRLGDAQYGLQFHLEVTAAIVRSWLVQFRALQPDDGGVTAARVEAEVDRCIEDAAIFARRIGDRWMAMVAARAAEAA